MPIPTTILSELLAHAPAVITFSKPMKHGAWTDAAAERLRTTVRPIRVVVQVDIGIRVEAFTSRQCFTSHHPAESLATLLELCWESGYGQTLVQTPGHDVQVLRSASRETIRRAKPSRTQWDALTSDRRKMHHLEPQRDAALLHALDLASADGTILASMADKYRQLNHLIDQAMHLACVRTQQPLHIIDAGCGKAYLSLALFYVLQREGHDVTLLGVDTNPHVIDHASQVATQLCLDHCSFVVQPIRSLWTLPAQTETGRATLLIALHACDTATDDALMTGLTLHADAMLVAPCCHHYVQQQLTASTAPEAVRLLLDDGITKERLGDLLTDTMRRDIVRAYGYEAHLQEFISLEHTMKNVLLKAERRRRQPNVSRADLSSVVHTAQTWGARPMLLDIVSSRDPHNP